MFDSQTYDLTQQLQGAIFQAAIRAYQAASDGNSLPTLSPLFQLRRGYAESPGWLMVQAAEFDPEPLTVELFRKRAVYSAPGLTHALLELLASEKLLDRRGEAYYLTDEGYEFIQESKTRQTAVFEGFAPLPGEDLDQLERLMRSVLDASLASGDPPGTWCLEKSRNRLPAEDAATMIKILHHCSDFNAFRDDAHMAAYQPRGVSGHIWEAFNFIRDKRAANANDLFDQLAYRGFSRLDWQDSLDWLVKHGWLVMGDSSYEVTDTGEQIYHQVERDTDMYFYAPWKKRGNDVASEFREKMQTLYDACQV